MTCRYQSSIDIYKFIFGLLYHNDKLIRAITSVCGQIWIQYASTKFGKIKLKSGSISYSNIIFLKCDIA